MAWLMALHITFLVLWCTGLFYLPALFASYASAHTLEQRIRMRIVTRFVFVVIVSPSAVMAIITGTALVFATTIEGTWLPAKLLVVSLMGAYHVYCGRRVVQLEAGDHIERRTFHIVLVAVPAVLVSTVLWLVLAKPALPIPVPSW
ncbi:hypothetical protein FOZ76_19985 [Verticiella sediminum]|uniref:Protoporphyrinogen IX oxidase n=1 Tax=Verticiella sediminum TaxID=1247510 RepID=A0A556AB58_9BURK|nr:CopD family protein [Verticiella sediminum]TSH90126.1 hypothetical protein FOZ76_19985 [Verticiella sediminum]